MVKSVLNYGAETWSLYEDDRIRINVTEMDGMRRSARISKLDRKTNEYIRGYMDAQDTILDDIIRKQLIWYGMLRERTQCDCQKLCSTGNLKVVKNEVVPEEPVKIGYI
jgi:hypothetical protein